MLVCWCGVVCNCSPERLVITLRAVSSGLSVSTTGRFSEDAALILMKIELWCVDDTLLNMTMT